MSSISDFVSSACHYLPFWDPAVEWQRDPRTGQEVPIKAKDVIVLRVVTVTLAFFTTCIGTAVANNKRHPLLYPVVSLMMFKPAIWLSTLVESWETARADAELDRWAIAEFKSGKVVPTQAMDHLVNSPAGVSALLQSGHFSFDSIDSAGNSLFDRVVKEARKASEQSAVYRVYTLFLKHLIDKKELTSDRFMTIIQSDTNRRLAKTILQKKQVPPLSPEQQEKCLELSNPELLPLFIANGCDINPKEGRSPLENAIQSHQPKKISTLLRLGAKVSDSIIAECNKTGGCVWTRPINRLLRQAKKLDNLLPETPLRAKRIDSYCFSLLPPAIADRATYRDGVADRVSKAFCFFLCLATPFYLATFNPLPYLGLPLFIPCYLYEKKRATQRLHELALERFKQDTFPDPETTGYILNHLPLLDRVIASNKDFLKPNECGDNLLDQTLRDRPSGDNILAAFKKLIDHLVSCSTTIESEDVYGYLLEMVQHPDIRYLKYAVDRKWMTSVSSLTDTQRIDVLLRISDPDMMAILKQHLSFTIEDINHALLKLLYRSIGENAIHKWDDRSQAILKALIDNGANLQTESGEKSIQKYLKDPQANKAAKILLETPLNKH